MINTRKKMQASKIEQLDKKIAYDLFNCVECCRAKPSLINHPDRVVVKKKKSTCYSSSGTSEVKIN